MNRVKTVGTRTWTMTGIRRTWQYQDTKSSPVYYVRWVCDETALGWYLSKKVRTGGQRIAGEHEDELAAAGRVLDAQECRCN